MFIDLHIMVGMTGVQYKQVCEVIIDWLGVGDCKSWIDAAFSVYSWSCHWEIEWFVLTTHMQVMTKLLLRKLDMGDGDEKRLGKPSLEKGTWENFACELIHITSTGR